MSHKLLTSHKDQIKGFTILLLIRRKDLLFGFTAAPESASSSQRRTSSSIQGRFYLVILCNRSLVVGQFLKALSGSTCASFVFDFFFFIKLKTASNQLNILCFILLQAVFSPLGFREFTLLSRNCIVLSVGLIAGASGEIYICRNL